MDLLQSTNMWKQTINLQPHICHTAAPLRRTTAPRQLHRSPIFSQYNLNLEPHFVTLQPQTVAPLCLTLDPPTDFNPLQHKGPAPRRFTRTPHKHTAGQHSHILSLALYLLLHECFIGPREDQHS